MKTIELANIWTDNFDVNEKHYYDNQYYILFVYKRHYSCEFKSKHEKGSEYMNSKLERRNGNTYKSYCVH